MYIYIIIILLIIYYYTVNVYIQQFFAISVLLMSTVPLIKEL